MRYYRFKTHDELVERFGEDYASQIRDGWDETKEKLFAGKAFESEEKPTKGGSILYKEYPVSYQMLIRITAEEYNKLVADASPDLNKKKKKEEEAKRIEEEKQRILREQAAIKEKQLSELLATIKVNISNSQINVHFNAPAGYNRSFLVFNAPTSNCQVASVAGFDAAINYVSTEFLKAFIRKALSSSVTKKLFLFDIHQSLLEKLIASGVTLVGEPVKYESTNHSKMVYGMIRI